MNALPYADLEHVLRYAEPVLRQLDGERLFITGGTGFFGIWLLESLSHANHRLGLSIRASVLSRDPTAFARRAPHLADSGYFTFLAGDVCDFVFPAGHFGHVVHAATETTAGAVPAIPAATFSVISDGTRRVLDFAAQAGASNFLLTSSGAAYGRQPADLPTMPETWVGAPDPCDTSSAYGEGKRVAEMMCAFAQRQYGLHARIARGFAFVGPHLPLNAHFAIGNFMRDTLAGQDIRIGGDGRPWRSYLHAADLATWLLTILMEGRDLYPYNVGSDEALTVADLAHRVAAQAQGFSPPRVHIAQGPSGGLAHRYVPDIARARNELGLEVRIGLDDAIRRTLAWHAGQA